MSTLAEIEAAIETLPAPQMEELAAWIEQRRLHRELAASAAEPDFLARAKTIWGEKPAGTPLSELASEARAE